MTVLTTANKFILNHMNSSAFKAQLGSILGAGSIVGAGQFTTAGGDVNEVITVTGMLATDTPIVSIETKGAVPVTLVASTAAAGQINVELSADPSTDHVLAYVVLRVV